MKFIIPIFLLITYTNASCFTMPPKAMAISKWAFTIPNTQSPTYKHETHQCPKGYQLDSEYSHIQYEPGLGLVGDVIINLSIYGYAVCCETEIYEISVKDNFTSSI
jgi:hypothetical protein